MLGRIEVEQVKREIVVVVNIMVVRCKIIGDGPRTLFILIANILFAHDDEAARRALLCARWGSSI